MNDRTIPAAKTSSKIETTENVDAKVDLMYRAIRTMSLADLGKLVSQ